MGRLNVSYHTYAMIRDCRQRYKLQLTKVPTVKPEDNRNAIYGIVTQRLFERFYVEEWFRLGQKATQKLYDELPVVLREQLAKHVCLWEHRSELELLEIDCQKAIPLFIQAVRRYALLGEKNQSEFTIGFDLSSQFRLTGRVDFLIHKRADLILLDGKGTKYDMKYLDDEQLLYYMLIMHKARARMPTKVGFWMWRVGEVRWIDTSLNRIEDLDIKVKEVLYHVQQRDFTANPCSKSCRFCPYAGPPCQAYQNWHLANQARLAQARSDRLDLPEPGQDGVLEIAAHG